jgi:hypothetical protein
MHMTSFPFILMSNADGGAFLSKVDSLTYSSVTFRSLIAQMKKGW